MNPNFRFVSQENGIDNLNFGIMEDLPWRADVHIIGGVVNVLYAEAFYIVDEEEKTIEITRFVRTDWDAKEAIYKQWERERAELFEPDEDRPYDEWKDNGGEVA